MSPDVHPVSGYYNFSLFSVNVLVDLVEQETVRKFFEQKVSKRVVHFVGKTARESVLLREGSCTEDGRRPGITIELPRLASYREVRASSSYVFLMFLLAKEALERFLRVIA